MLGLLSSPSCGYEGPEFTTRHGLRVWSWDYEQEEIELQTQLLLDKLHTVKHYKYNPFKNHNLEVNFTHSLIECPVEPAGCYGDSSMNDIRVYAYTDCLSATGFVHELAHVARGIVQHDMDYEHRDDKIFGPDGIVSELTKSCEE